MNAAEEYWYEGKYGEYRNLPWLHDPNTIVIMPWTVVDVCPMGYIVFLSSGGTKFKMLNKPTVVIGDIIS
jgi:hypothetical protein